MAKKESKIVYVQHKETGIIHSVWDTHEAVKSSDFTKSTRAAYEASLGAVEEPVVDETTGDPK